MAKVRRSAASIYYFRDYIANREPMDYGLSGYPTYWDLIGRWFSGESQLDILKKSHDGGIVIRIFQEDTMYNQVKDRTHFFIEAYDGSDKSPYFVRIHKDAKSGGVFLTYLGEPPWH